MGLTEEVQISSQRSEPPLAPLRPESGVSTVVFALAGTPNICITPAEQRFTHQGLILAENISVDEVAFMLTVQRTSAGTRVRPLDMVLIDGPAWVSGAFHRFLLPGGQAED